MDVGWISDPYELYNSTNFTQKTNPVNSAKQVIERQIDQLKERPDLSFSFSIYWFLHRFWHDPASIPRRTQLLKEIEEKRFELVGAGGAEHDEACNHYQAMVDNMIWSY
jgi:hypothetical protein